MEGRIFRTIGARFHERTLSKEKQRSSLVNVRISGKGSAAKYVMFDGLSGN